MELSLPFLLLLELQVGQRCGSTFLLLFGLTNASCAQRRCQDAYRCCNNLGFGELVWEWSVNGNGWAFVFHNAFFAITIPLLQSFCLFWLVVVGDYLSSKAEHEFQEAERKREKWYLLYFCCFVFVARTTLARYKTGSVTTTWRERKTKWWKYTCLKACQRRMLGLSWIY